MIAELFAHRGWPFVVFMVGACIGSFLNVVIHRLPRGLGVSEPKRSFCPHCREPIPWYRNIPLVTWLVQRGKCGACGGPIAFRYFAVELLTAVLFVVCWLLFPPLAALFAMVFCVLLVSISFIDAEHMVIPVHFTWAGMVIGVLAGVTAPVLVTLAGEPLAAPSWRGGGEALLGLAAGWGVLAAVVLLGKVCFGARNLRFDKATEWYLREPETEEEELSFVIGDEQIGWSEIFYRKRDRIEIKGHGVLLDGNRTKATEVIIRADAVDLHGESHDLEKIEALSGKAETVRIPREAMGAGDPPLLGMIGAFIGWHGVLFTLFASCIFALVAALLGRVGFGRPLPFGPFLALGGLAWLFGGWQLWQLYFEFVGGIGMEPPVE
ncbi:MAG: prepilin peptidase [Akkermansiaceae bacterium]|nr:prepilin peptidase [Akkermansiaceae bacterium]